MARLVAQGLLLERRNALGSRSLCMTRGGAAWLELRGVEAQHTLDLSSVAGSTFFHRTLATRYLIERKVEGYTVAGEYLLLRRKTPFPAEALVKALRKLPDGAVWRRGADGHVSVELGRVNTNGDRGDCIGQSRAWRSRPHNSPLLSTACPSSVATSA